MFNPDFKLFKMWGFSQSLAYEPKKRAKKADPNALPAELRAAVHKKIFKTNVKKFTNWEFKNYASDVLEFICKIIQGNKLRREDTSFFFKVFYGACSSAFSFTVEVNDIELCKNGQTQLAWEIVHEVLIDMLDCLHGIPSYCLNFDLLSFI